VAVCGNNTFVTISAGNSHTVALDNNGWCYTWGNNTQGQLGTGNLIQRLTPMRICNGVHPGTGIPFVHVFAKVEGYSAMTLALTSAGVA